MAATQIASNDKYKVITTKETFITDTTTFKLVVWFNLKPSGIPYTSFEKEMNKNRKYVESYDYIITLAGKKQTRHDLAFKKLGHFYNDHIKTLTSAILFLNEFETRQQHRIALLFNNKERNIKPCLPMFTDPDEHGNVFFKTLVGNPIKTHQLINKTIEYTKATTNYIQIQ